MLVACLVCQMGLGMSYVFSTFLRPIVTELGWTRTIFAGYSFPLLLSMSLSAPLVGQLTDRLGPRAVLSGSTLLLAVALALFSAMQNPLHFYATAILLGVALTGLGDIPVGAVASRWFERGRGLALGVIYTGSNIGGSIVPIAAVAIKESSSWRVALVVLAVAAIAVILPCAWLVRMPLPRAAADGVAAVEMRASRALDLTAALRTRTFWILGAALFVFYFYYIGVLFNLVAFLGDIGYSDPGAASRFAGAVAMGIVGKLAMGLLADRVPKKAALIANFGLVTLSSILLLFVADRTLLYVFLVVYGFSVAAENVLLPLIVAEAFGVRYMAQIYGALMFALLPGGALGPVFAARVYDTRGSYDAAFLTFAVLNVASLGSLAFVRRHAPRTTDA